MLIHLFGNWELSIDWHQWMIGFNCYKEERLYNIFIGPIRIGYIERFWSSCLKKLKDIPSIEVKC